MECNVPEFTVCWTSGTRILAETEPYRGLEFRVSPDGKPIFDQYVGVFPEDVSERHLKTARKAVEAFLRRQHGKSH